MRRDETLLERRALVTAVVVCVVAAAVVSVAGHPPIGMALFAVALVCVAIEHARGHV